MLWLLAWSTETVIRIKPKVRPYLLAFLFLNVTYHLNSRHIGFFVLSRVPPGFERWRVNLVRVPDPDFVLQLSHLTHQGTLHSTWLIFELDCP